MNAISIEDLKKDNRTAAEWLLFYEFRKAAYQEDYIEALNGRKAIENIGGGKSGVGNPTLTKTVMISDIIYAEKWIKTIDDVHRMLGEKKLIFLKVRREAVNMTSKHKERGRPAWVPYVQRRCTEELMNRYGLHQESCPSERILTEWWRKIIDLTVRVAMKRGLL